MHKDFIGERGFNKLISPFIEVIEKRGWSLLCEHKPAGFAIVVRECFANLVGKKERMCYIRGKWISFDREEINRTYNLKEQKDGSKFKKFLKDPTHQKIVELLTDRKEEWHSTKKNPYESITRRSLIEEAKVLFYFLSSVLLPSKHLSMVRKEEALLLNAILKGYKLNVGKIIENLILNYYNSKYKGLIPHPETITRLCILRGVEGTWEEEERCPKTSPLTLIGITGPLTSKGKEKVKDIEEQDRDGRENEQAI